MGHYVEVEKDINLFVEDIGQGQPIIFIHGWPVNHKMFEYQMNELPKHGYRFIGIDLRGYGKSDRPWTGYNYDRQADDIRAVIEYLQLENAVLAGFSMGGPIALRYMARHEAFQISKLILLAPAAPKFTKSDDYTLGIEPVEVDDMITAIQKDRPGFLRGFGEKFFHQEPSEPFRQWFGSLGLEASAHGTIHSAKALRDEDSRPDLAAINVSTLILHGKFDEICPYTFASQLAEEITNAKVIDFENSGHGLIFEEKEKVNSEILSFLS